ncbi:hypothetical protein FQN57_004201 [Myotisia sp. PD_48]|nr:hypothetical protein FQN57_004201 [Myotisia sp. PD_48]
MKFNSALLLTNLAGLAVAAPAVTSNGIPKGQPAVTYDPETAGWWTHISERDIKQGSPAVYLPHALNGLSLVLEHERTKPSSKKSKRAAAGEVENQIENGGPCQPLTFIFARGTSEPGNMGDSVGPAVVRVLRSRLNNKVSVQGVGYPATPASNLSLGAIGGPKLAKLVNKVRSQCPSTKISLSGFSQGAMVVHNGVGRLNFDVSSVVAFGDPLRFAEFENVAAKNVKQFCAKGDPVCLNGVDPDAHGTYPQNANEAATFILRAAGLA